MNSLTSLLGGASAIVVIYVIVSIALFIAVFVWLHNCSSNSYRIYMILKSWAEKNGVNVEPEESSEHVFVNKDLRNQDLNEHLSKARKYYESNDFEKAALEYKRAVQINPSSATASVEYANTLFQLNKFAEAKLYYGRAINIKPDEASYHFNLGQLLVEMIEFDEAEKEFRKALFINPDDIEAKAALEKLLELKSKQQ